jgi:hypothetical protein
MLELWVVTTHLEGTLISSYIDISNNKLCNIAITIDI